jgi:simple sugar transport system permease protein
MRQPSALEADRLSSTDEAIVRIEGLTRVYRQEAVAVHALGGIDLEIRRGDFAVLVGPSGSGKTTLLNMIGGLDSPTTGRLWVAGTEIGGMSPAQRSDMRLHRIGFVFQEFNLIPVLIVALGTILATRCGIINIGQEGQLIIGATLATWVALEFPGGYFPAIAATIVVAGIGGALWAGIAAALRFTRKVDVVISTLLLNFVAGEVVSFAVNRDYLLRETAIGGQLTVPQSDRIPDNTHLPRIGSFPDFNVSTGLFLALALTVVVAIVVTRTRWGFRLRMLGLNPMAAASAGVSVAAMGSTALILSGAFAGAAGGAMLTGTSFRLQPGFSQSVGYDGLLVALIARRNALACVPVAFFFGVLRAGGGFLASTGVPRYLVNIVQSLLVLAALFPPVFVGMRERRKELARARAAALMTDGSGAELEAA